ncbi:MAG: hypothetical protein IPL78_06405 [Chloroflexi bacterium]|nr:hypothetical protein [Chloroflexota bacterium]
MVGHSFTATGKIFGLDAARSRNRGKQAFIVQNDNLERIDTDDGSVEWVSQGDEEGFVPFG